MDALGNKWKIVNVIDAFTMHSARGPGIDKGMDTGPGDRGTRVPGYQETIRDKGTGVPGNYKGPGDRGTRVPGLGK